MKKISVDLPPGVVVNPDATPVRCVESDLQAGHARTRRRFGLVHLTTGIFGFANPRATAPIYNMVAPPGTPSVFGFDAAVVPVFVHITGRVNPDGGYSLSAGADNLLEYGNISGFSVELWGDPSAASHGNRRRAMQPARRGLSGHLPGRTARHSSADHHALGLLGPARDGHSDA